MPGEKAGAVFFRPEVWRERCPIDEADVAAGLLDGCGDHGIGGDGCPRNAVGRQERIVDRVQQQRRYADVRNELSGARLCVVIPRTFEAVQRRGDGVVELTERFRAARVRCRFERLLFCEKTSHRNLQIEPSRFD